MSEADFGLTNKGSVAMEGPTPTAIDAGMPSGGSPGSGDLTPPFAGEHIVGGPVAGSGPIK
jgi:hypothetical protein